MLNKPLQMELKVQIH